MKPLIDRPGNATALSTAGSFRAMSDIWRITFSVRSSVAPSGSCAKLTRYMLVLHRHEARRHHAGSRQRSRPAERHRPSARADLRVRMPPTPLP